MLAVLALGTGRPLLPAPGERLGLALVGLLGYGTESALYFGALNHGSAATVTLLFYLYPVWVMLAASLLERRVPARTLVLPLVMALAGGAIVIVGGAGVDIETAGIVLALGCSLAYTGYLVATERIAIATNPMTTGLVGRRLRVDGRTSRTRSRRRVVEPAERRARPVARDRDGRVHRGRVPVHDGEPPADRRGAQRDHRRPRAADRRGARRDLPRANPSRQP